MTIVAAVDRAPRAKRVVAEAHELAQAFGDDLDVIHVLSRSEFVELERTSVDNTGQALDMDEIREIAAEFAEEAAEDLDGEFTPVGRVGKAREEVIRYADQQNARYIVVGPRKRSPTGKAVFGSTAQAILLNASQPVVTVIGD